MHHRYYPSWHGEYGSAGTELGYGSQWKNKAFQNVSHCHGGCFFTSFLQPVLMDSKNLHYIIFFLWLTVKITFIILTIIH